MADPGNYLGAWETISVGIFILMYFFGITVCFSRFFFTVVLRYWEKLFIDLRINVGLG